MRVKPIVQRVAQQIRHRLMRSDILNHQHIGDAVGDFSVVQTSWWNPFGVARLGSRNC